MLSSTLEITSLSLGTEEIHSIPRRRQEEQRFPLVQPTHGPSSASTNQARKKKNHALLHHPLNPRHPPPPLPHHHHLRHPQNHSSSTRSSSRRQTTLFQTETPQLVLLLRQQRWRTTLRGHNMHDLDRRTRRRDEFQKSHCGV